MTVLGLLLPLLLLTSAPGLCDSICPKNCVCDALTSGLSKLRCGTEFKVSTLGELQLGESASKILQLNLSSNDFQTLPSSDGPTLPNIRKLDLSRNKLTRLEKGAFKRMGGLRQLDLSGNQLTSLRLDTLHDLGRLKQLDISDNPLTCSCELIQLVQWLQDKSVRLLSNPRCTPARATKPQNLKRLKANFHELCESVITDAAAKATPTSSSAAGLDAESTTLRLRPAQDQIVFEGDPLRLHCFVSGGEARPSWSVAGKLPTVTADAPEVTVAEEADGRSTLLIARLDRRHSGEWRCAAAMVSVSVQVIVITADTRYCPATVTQDSRGVYAWPETIAGHAIELPCSTEGARATHKCTADGRWELLDTAACPYASETTKILQQFSKVNLTLAKVYESAVQLRRNFTAPGARVLRDKMDVVFVARTVLHYLEFVGRDRHQLGRVLADIVSDLADLARGLLRDAHSEDGSCGKLAHAIEHLAEHTPVARGRFVAQELKLKRDGFPGMVCTWYAEEMPATTTSPPPRVHCTTQDNNATLVEQLRRLVVEANVQISSDALFRVDVANQMQPLHHPHQQKQATGSGGLAVPSHRLLVTMYTDGRLFPPSTMQQVVVTAVVGLKLVSSVFLASENQTATTTPTSSPTTQGATETHEPLVFVMLRESGSGTGARGPARPVVWDDTLDRGHGGWSNEGCKHTTGPRLDGHYMFHCDRLGHYAVLRDAVVLGAEAGRGKAGETGEEEDVDDGSGAPFRLSHPATYVGGLVLLSCLGAAASTYLACHSSIQMAGRAKHALVNSWLAVALLCFLYTFGVHQTVGVRTCRAIGLALHYLTLSALLWTCVAIDGIYRRARARAVPANMADLTVMSEGDVSEDGRNGVRRLGPHEGRRRRRRRRPILGLYLVGWGVALIVCGISGAVNIRDYSSRHVCFMTTSAALSALYVPAALLIAFALLLCLLAKCALGDNEAIAQLSEGTQATENVDLDTLDEVEVPTGPPVMSVTAVIYSSSLLDDEDDYGLEEEEEEEEEDGEHAPMVQLRAHLIVLLGLVGTWCCGAGAALPPTSMPHAEDVFGIAYALLASALGVFVLFFYCVARNDVRTELARGTNCCRCCCISSKRLRRDSGTTVLCCRPRGVRDTNHQRHLVVSETDGEMNRERRSEPHGHHNQHHMATTSRSSSRNSSSGTGRRIKVRNNHLAAAVGLNREPKSHNGGGNGIISGGCVSSSAGATGAPFPGGSAAAKVENVDLVVLHRQQYRRRSSEMQNVASAPVYELSTMESGAERFYNPHQSGVARKFFRRQKRNMMRHMHNNLGTVASRHHNHHHHDPHEQREQDLLGTGSKVNNTNIHVDQTQVRQPRRSRNPNMLLDDGTEYPVTKLDIPSVAAISSAPVECGTTRTISQQCSLEYSSETLCSERQVVVGATATSPETNVYVNPMEGLEEGRSFKPPQPVMGRAVSTGELTATAYHLPIQRRRHSLN